MGAIGLGIGLAGVGAIHGALSHQIRDFDTNWFVGTLLYALAGGFGAAVLGLARQPRGRLLPLTWAGALGLGLGYSVTTWIFYIYIYVEERLSAYLPLMMAHSLRFAAMGAVAGAGLGAVEKNWKQAGRLALAGALGWALYPWVRELVWATHLRTRLIPGLVGEIPHDWMRWAIEWAAGNGIGGALVGGCLGIAQAMPSPGATLPAGDAGFTRR